MKGALAMWILRRMEKIAWTDRETKVEACSGGSRL